MAGKIKDNNTNNFLGVKIMAASECKYNFYDCDPEINFSINCVDSHVSVVYVLSFGKSTMR